MTHWETTCNRKVPSGVSEDAYAHGGSGGHKLREGPENGPPQSTYYTSATSLQSALNNEDDDPADWRSFG